MRSSPAARLFGALACVASALEAASYRISLGQDFSQAGKLKISPDGVWAVYVQDAETELAGELWRVRVEGGAPARVSGPLPADSEVQSFVVSPNSQWVAYTAPEDDLDHLDLYSASLVNPAGGGLKLNSTLSPGEKVKTMRFAPDSSRVVFAVGPDSGIETTALWSAKPDGSDLDLLLGLMDNEEIPTWLITGDSQFVLLIADWATAGSSVLRVPLVGGGLFELSSDLPAPRDAMAIAASPDGVVAAYSANRDGADRFEIFRVPVAGGSPQQISGEFGFEDAATSPQFSPDGSRVVYMVVKAGGNEIWSVEPDGDGNVKLNGALVDLGAVLTFKISPDSSRVVYRADQQTNDEYELYTVPIAGGANFKLNGTLDDDGDVDFDYAIAADSARVAFLGDVEQNGRRDLYSAPITGGPATRLNFASLATPTNVVSFALSASGKQVFYLQNAFPFMGDLTRRVWGVPITGGVRVRVDGCDEPGELVEELSLVASPVRDYRALYIANEEPAGTEDVYAGDVCVFCNGFEGTWRWSSAPP